ncbi:MAG: DUF554 domain-containing protein [Oscillospiraceae bacterium]|nr:DUF554 domain-containing protein [Oscillospiraceae bacterium]
MVGLGTLLNALGVIIGGVLGLLFRRGIKAEMRNILMCACGVCVIFIGAGGVFGEMFYIEGSRLATQGTMMFISSLALGGIVGEWIDLETKTERFGAWLKKKTHSENDNTFIEGFVTTSLTICVGAMAVVGSITDGLTGDWSILFTKGILDMIIVLVTTASLGKGCIFSVIPIVAIQGTITAAAKLVEPLMTEQALSNMSFVGSALIFCVGINLLFGKKVRVANLLPSLIFAVAWAFLPF